MFFIQVKLKKIFKKSYNILSMEAKVQERFIPLFQADLGRNLETTREGKKIGAWNAIVSTV